MLLLLQIWHLLYLGYTTVDIRGGSHVGSVGLRPCTLVYMGCSKQYLRVACGFAGGLLVKALDCEPKGPRFQSHLQDFWVHSALPKKLSGRSSFMSFGVSRRSGEFLINLIVVQWNLSITDTIGNQHFVPYSEVSLTQGLPVYFR